MLAAQAQKNVIDALSQSQLNLTSKLVKFSGPVEATKGTDQVRLILRHSALPQLKPSAYDCARR